VGDLPNYTNNPPMDLWGGRFPGNENFQPMVDDVVIGWEVTDLPGTTIGRAGPTVIRLDMANNFREGAPIAGTMRFDRDFLSTGTDRDIETVILHEMGHVLGIGVLDCTGIVRRDNCNPLDPVFGGPFDYTCQNAIREFNALTDVTGPFRMENNGGRGSACGHWEEDMFSHPTTSEFMTWRYNRNEWQPLSRVTVGGVDDISFYVVDYNNADPYPVLGPRPLSMTGGMGDYWATIPYMTMQLDLSNMTDYDLDDIIGIPM